MKLTLAIAVGVTMAAGTVLAQCPGCPKATGHAAMSMPAQTGELSGLRLVSLAGDVFLAARGADGRTGVVRVCGS